MKPGFYLLAILLSLPALSRAQDAPTETAEDSHRIKPKPSMLKPTRWQHHEETKSGATTAAFIGTGNDDSGGQGQSAGHRKDGEHSRRDFGRGHHQGAGENHGFRGERGPGRPNPDNPGNAGVDRDAPPQQENAGGGGDALPPPPPPRDGAAGGAAMAGGSGAGMAGGGGGALGGGGAETAGGGDRGGDNNNQGFRGERGPGRLNADNPGDAGTDHSPHWNPNATPGGGHGNGGDGGGQGHRPPRGGGNR